MSRSALFCDLWKWIWTWIWIVDHAIRDTRSACDIEGPNPMKDITAPSLLSEDTTVRLSRHKPGTRSEVHYKLRRECPSPIPKLSWVVNSNSDSLNPLVIFSGDWAGTSFRSSCCSFDHASYFTRILGATDDSYHFLRIIWPTLLLLKSISLSFIRSFISTITRLKNCVSVQNFVIQKSFLGSSLNHVAIARRWEP